MPQEPDVHHASEKCPECGHGLAELRKDERACLLCGYWRSAPAPGTAVIGIVGRGSYEILRDRFLIATMVLCVGKVVATVRGSDLARGLGTDLQVNFAVAALPEYVIDDATHVFFLTDPAPEWRQRVAAAGKQHMVFDAPLWPRRKHGAPAHDHR